MTDAYIRTALAISRSLGRKGVNVGCVSDKRYAHSFFSRYCNYRFLCPDPSKSPSSFVNALLKILKSRKFEVLLPVEQETVLLVSKNKEKFTPYVKVPLVDFDKMIVAANKSLLMRLASKLGIPHPKTYFVNSLDELKEVSKELNYPTVIKPSIKSGAWGVAYANTPADLYAKYRALHRVLGEYPLIQEYVSGNGYGVEALFNESSQLRAVVVHKRLREYPITGGQSTLRETIWDPEMKDLGVRLLKALKWYGVAMVEFRRDTNQGKPVLMEINPRFWGSLSLAMAAGVDFPSLLYEMAIKGDVEEILNYKVGVKARWFLPGDLISLVETLVYGQKKARRSLDFLKMYEKGIVYDELSKDDLNVIPGLILQLSCQFLEPKAIQKYFFKESVMDDVAKG